MSQPLSHSREHWSSNVGFILAATGSAIGLGNLWKFPFITWQNNGGAFVLLYLICIAAVGLSITMAELLIGRKTRESVVGALKDESFEGKAGVFATLDHFAANWAVPLGGLLITLGAGWFMTREATENELVDETTPGLFNYGAWRFFLRFADPTAVAAILIAVIFYGVDFS